MLANKITRADIIGGEKMKKSFVIFPTCLFLSMRIKLRDSRAQLVWTENTPKVWSNFWSESKSLL